MCFPTQHAGRFAPCGRTRSCCAVCIFLPLVYFGVSSEFAAVRYLFGRNTTFYLFLLLPMGPWLTFIVCPFAIINLLLRTLQSGCLSLCRDGPGRGVAGSQDWRLPCPWRRAAEPPSVLSKSPPSQKAPWGHPLTPAPGRAPPSAGAVCVLAKLRTVWPQACHPLGVARTHPEQTEGTPLPAGARRSFRTRDPGSDPALGLCFPWAAVATLRGH